ncbi:MAG: transcriptional regulator [Opitutia bacterium]|nr:MAG: transcriptional regulator [Opitutae bacterium]
MSTSTPRTGPRKKTAVSASRGARSRKPAGLKPSAAREDYLECISQLIGSKGYARAVDIAATLEIAQASVTNMTQRLAIEGLLKYEKYRGVTLTAEGEKLAADIILRHLILTRLLRHFGMDEHTIYRDVEGMEHHVSRQALRGFKALTEALDASPELAKRVRLAMG